MNEINDNTNNKKPEGQKGGDWDLLSVIKDNNEANIGKTTELEKAIQEVASAIEAVSRKMANLPPEYQQIMKDNAAYMAKKGEPAYELFLSKC
jgi:3-methyladenine DNA glycosylase/8-oxoguanine DNA glycosylase